MSNLLDQIANVVSPGGLLTGEDVSNRAAGVWRRDTIKAKAIVRPRSTEEVSAVMKLCHAAEQRVIAQGGLTGLVHGSDTSPDDIVISLERMNEIEEINVVDRTATVQSGVVLQTLQEQATENGLLFPVDLGGRGSCTVGGNISTNAGGNRVFRYGMTRDSVLGLEAVLADGTVVSAMNRMIKNNSGYDLKHWFIGTEGTLGIVTRAIVRLREEPASQETLFVGFESFAQVSGFLKHMDRALGGMLSAFEVMWQDVYRAWTTEPGKHTPPLSQDYPFYALVESMGGDATADRARVETAVGEALEAGLVADAVIAESEAQRQGLWAIRDDVEFLVVNYSPQIGFDVSLPISEMEGYVEEVQQRLADQFETQRCFVFGHLGDGNLHLVVNAPGRASEFRTTVERCVYEPLASRHGAVSAEHGVGLEKKPYLYLCRSEDEIAVMQRMKLALDPKGLLNPGKIFDVHGAEPGPGAALPGWSAPAEASGSQTGSSAA